MRRQLDLLAATPISFDPGFADLRRSELADGAWVDHVPGWVRGHDQLFGRPRALADLAQRDPPHVRPRRRHAAPARQRPRRRRLRRHPRRHARRAVPRHAIPKVAHAPGPRIAVMFRPDWRY
jgi:hypothetical protein